MKWYQMYRNIQTIIKNIFIQICVQHKPIMQCVSSQLAGGALNQLLLCYVIVLHWHTGALHQQRNKHFSCMRCHTYCKKDMASIPTTLILSIATRTKYRHEVKWNIYKYSAVQRHMPHLKHQEQLNI